MRLRRDGLPASDQDAREVEVRVRVGRLQRKRRFERPRCRPEISPKKLAESQVVVTLGVAWVTGQQFPKPSGGVARPTGHEQGIGQCFQRS